LLRRRDPLQLADAQYTVASELGYASWPELVRALDVDVSPFTVIARNDIDWGRVDRLTLVPFLPDGSVVLVDDDGRLRVPRMRCFRMSTARGRTAPTSRWNKPASGARNHPFAAAEDRRDSPYGSTARYDGARPHNRAVVDRVRAAAGGAARATRRTRPPWCLADAARRPHRRRVLDRQPARLDAAYLAAVSPEGGSGSAAAQDWHDERSVLLDAVDRDGSFLDVGCANGLLMESLARWSDARGVRLEPYGVDISEPLAALARRRLPQWADRIWTGNALEWVAPNGQQFDYVHTLLETVPAPRHAALVGHLLDTAVAPGGRLLVSHYGVEEDRKAAAILARLGYAVAGETRAPGRADGRRRPPSAWIDKSSGGSRRDG
jgi:2-polyprenyl-3-methyl-5-hydroxy-6-metoxy-1,4-benzoquinol methylase